MLDKVVWVSYIQVDMNNPAVESKLRRATKGQLVALDVIAKAPNSLATTTAIQDALYSQVSNPTGSTDQSVGGTISAISRIKIDNQPLILPMGKDEEEGIRWQLNGKLVEKDQFAGLVDEILQAWK